MDRGTGIGGVLLALGFGGYGVGVYTPYTGRAFSLTAIMVGITLVATASQSTARRGL